MNLAIVGIPLEIIREGNKEKVYQEVLKSMSSYPICQTLQSRNKFYEYLDKMKYKRTWERDKILNAILRGEKIFTCKKILNSLKETTETSVVSRYTVNRTFELLVNAEVIRRVNNNVDGLFQTMYFELSV